MRDLPIHWRLLIIAAACLGFLALDLLKPRGQRKRWREYLFLIGSGVATALFGAVVDSVTSTISPEYFLLGKGLATTSWSEVSLFGLQAGFGPGIIGGAVLLFANPHPQHALRLFRTLSIPLGGALLGGVVAGLLYHQFPLFVHPAVSGLLARPPAIAFTTVWVIHLGIYVGGLAGLVWAVVRLRCDRARG